MKDVFSTLDFGKIDMLLTIGAGDIDRLADPIENELKKLKDR